VLAVVLIAIDVFALAHGMLTGSGIAVFLIGSLALSEGSDPLLRLLWGYIMEGVIVWAASFASVSAKNFVPSVCRSRLAQKRCWGKR
jgi:membrane-bound ClpP family serine protease